MNDSNTMDESNIVTFKKRVAIEENKNSTSGSDASTLCSIEHTMRRVMSEFRPETRQTFEILSATTDQKKA